MSCRRNGPHAFPHSWNQLSFSPLIYPDLGKEEINTGLFVISVAAKMLAERKEISGNICLLAEN